MSGPSAVVLSIQEPRRILETTAGPMKPSLPKSTPNDIGGDDGSLSFSVGSIGARTAVAQRSA
eukprot:6666000-Alexandrium_andersonii.AAC.1